MQCFSLILKTTFKSTTPCGVFNGTDHPCFIWLTQPVVFTSTQTHSCDGCEAPNEEWGWPAGTLRASTFVPQKAAPVFRDVFSQSPSAWVPPGSAHSWTFNSFPLADVGASATSDSESRTIVTNTELLLSFEHGGLGNTQYRAIN